MSAITADEIAQVIKLAEKVQSSGQKSDLPENTRVDLLDALTKLKAAYQTPVEATVELASGDMRHVVTRIAVDLGIFNQAAQSPNHQVSVSAIAKSSKADSNLIVRILRYLSTMGLVTKVDDDLWNANPSVNAWVDGSPLRDVIVLYQDWAGSAAALPRFLAQTGGKEPDSYDENPFKLAFGVPMWQWLEQHPEKRAMFHNLMIKARLDSEAWFESFPVDSLVEGDPSRPLLVDVGGGSGFDIVKFKRANPQLEGKGKLIWQDLPEVIEDAQTKIKDSSDYAGIEGMPYNFFDPQPIKNARAYYMRAVLHDWPDQSAFKILGNVRDAMPADARLLVNEVVIPDGMASPYIVWTDMTMMALFGAMERTNKQWLKLFDTAGFELVKEWYPKVMTAGAGVVFELKPKKT